ncbi:MAG: hypothetical protein ACFB2Z_00565 [Maricaulaceae bacterium]
MTRRLLILTGEREAPYLADYAKGVNRFLTVETATTAAQLDAALEGDCSRTRLLSFCTNIIVRKRHFAKLSLTPYNVHPGSPDYPGVYPEYFAMRDRVKRFGATLHEIIPQIDAGAIIAVEDFAVTGDMNTQTLAMAAYEAALRLFGAAVRVCAFDDGALNPSRWVWGPRYNSLDDFIDNFGAPPHPEAWRHLLEKRDRRKVAMA